MNPRHLALASVAAALSGLLAWQHLAPDPGPSRALAIRSAPGDGVPPETVTILPIAPPPGAFTAIVERPLFDPSRRPPEPPAAPVVERTVRQPAPLSGFTLIAIVIANGERLGVVQTPDRRRVELRAEDSLDLWTVKRIDSDRMVLETGTKQGVLALDPNR